MNDREFAAALRDRDAILILSHLRPDGDTLGSGAALCSALRRTDTVYIIHPFAICVNAAVCKKIMTRPPPAGSRQAITKNFTQISQTAYRGWR